ncbi:hypothetical protein BV25DRAFT_1826142 [Artomyces pyxidatus]|uniref:Uncharacterized protein n=1 Tax=Artomyces pyxidatus TaxID=48021 RepID=A0ACB8SZA4_9AGAM|nr:hypothetical protein BV25DRAFT_1826142 [Artomyces pyxidatus]
MATQIPGGCNTFLEDELRDVRRELVNVRDEFQSRISHQEQSFRRQVSRIEDDLKETRKVRDSFRDSVSTKAAELKLLKEENRRLAQDNEMLRRRLAAKPLSTASGRFTKTAISSEPRAPKVDIIEINDDEGKEEVLSNDTKRESRPPLSKLSVVGDLRLLRIKPSYAVRPTPTIPMSTPKRELPTASDESRSSFKLESRPSTKSQMKRPQGNSILHSHGVDVQFAPSTDGMKRRRVETFLSAPASESAVQTKQSVVWANSSSPKVTATQEEVPALYSEGQLDEVQDAQHAEFTAPPDVTGRYSESIDHAYIAVFGAEDDKLSDLSDSDEDSDKIIASVSSPQVLVVQGKGAERAHRAPSHASTSAHSPASVPPFLLSRVATFDVYPILSAAPTPVGRGFLAAHYRVPNCRLIGTIKAEENIPRGELRHMIFPEHVQNPGLPRCPGAPGTLLSNRTDVRQHRVISLWVKSWSTGSKATWMYCGEYEAQRSTETLSGAEFRQLPEKTKSAWVATLLTATKPCYASMAALIWLDKHGLASTSCALEETTNRFVAEIKAQKLAIRAHMKTDVSQKSSAKPKMGLGDLSWNDVLEGLCNGIARLDVITLRCVGYDYAFQNDVAASWATWHESN